MAQGSFPSVRTYLKEWSELLISKLRESAVLEMNLNKSSAKFPSVGDPQASPLVAGIRPVFSLLGKRVEAQIIMPQSWYWLEHGRAPGKFPPEEPIVRWLVQRGVQVKLGSRTRKRLTTTFGNRSYKRLIKQASMDKKRKQLAWLIRRHIADFGTRDTHFYSNVVTDKLITDLKTTMKERFKKDIQIDLLTIAQ
ncbi:MAG: hypothetical protein A2Z57_12040 [Planctomycetes bacterium RIFCSPHIGHO2_12_39_6]|nr:MAG: hypothetical protein A2Z57_12040 [Planctomycetes bacterium RIFCSPHIGHO2_12_39_6]